MITNVPWAHSKESKKHVFLIKNKMLQRITITFLSMKNYSHSLTLTPLIESTLTVSSRSSTGEVVGEQSSL